MDFVDEGFVKDRDLGEGKLYLTYGLLLEAIAVLKHCLLLKGETFW